MPTLLWHKHKKVCLVRMQSWWLSQDSRNWKQMTREADFWILASSAVPKSQLISKREQGKCPWSLICKRKTPVFFSFKWLFWCHHKMTLLTFLVKNIRRKRKKQNMVDAYRPVRTHISQWFQHCKDIPWHFIRTWGYSLSPLSTLPRTFLTRAQVILCTCTKIATFSL